MKAAVLKKVDNIIIEDLQRPVITSETEVLIEVICASVCCGTDYPYLKGFAKDFPVLPFVMGHECYGEVVSKGKKVENIEIGDRISYWFKNGGAFAEYVKIDTKRTVPIHIPENVKEKYASFFELTIACMRAVKIVNLKKRILILGAGPAGLLIGALLKIRNFNNIYIVDKIPLRLKIAESLSLFPVKVEEFKSFDIECFYVIDCINNEDDIGSFVRNHALKLMSPDGIYIAFSHPHNEVKFDLRTLSVKNITLTGLPNELKFVKRLAKECYDIGKAGLLPFEYFKIKEYSLKNVKDAILDSWEKPNQLIKAVINFE